jgi:hypothetical protein
MLLDSTTPIAHDDCDKKKNVSDEVLLLTLTALREDKISSISPAPFLFAA